MMQGLDKGVNEGGEGKDAGDNGLKGGDKGWKEVKREGCMDVTGGSVGRDDGKGHIEGMKEGGEGRGVEK